METNPEPSQRIWARFWRSKKRDQQGGTPQETCSHTANDNDTQEQQPCETCRDEKTARRKYRWRIILGLFLPFTLSSLDATIIASALPWIAADFNRISQMNWIISVFNLTAAAFIPFWGQMADLFGRHGSIQACMLFIIVGSALSTAAPSGAFPVLLLGRALQGTGSAGMEIIIRAIVADRVSLEEDAKNWSIFTFVGGVSYTVGPVVGG
jgi:MFS family permease